MGRSSRCSSVPLPAQQTHAGDGEQRALLHRSRFRQQLTRSIRRTNDTAARTSMNKGVDKELSDKHGLLLEMYDERAFSRDAIRELPELATELSAEENLLHVQVAVLGNAVLREA